MNYILPAVLLLATCGLSLAQGPSFPAKPIHLIVPFPPGGIDPAPDEFASQMRTDMDMTARLVKAIGVQPE